jgi:spore cortex formation protein SpoVR/YcgB (stage V sporulation)
LLKIYAKQVEKVMQEHPLKTDQLLGVRKEPEVAPAATPAPSEAPSPAPQPATNNMKKVTDRNKFKSFISESFLSRSFIQNELYFEQYDDATDRSKCSTGTCLSLILFTD